jgi:hypothetical protein
LDRAYSSTKKLLLAGIRPFKHSVDTQHAGEIEFEIDLRALAASLAVFTVASVAGKPFGSFVGKITEA